MVEIHTEEDLGRDTGPQKVPKLCGILFVVLPDHRAVVVYDSVMSDDQSTPTAFVLKRDEARLWTRSAGLRDGDAIAADMLSSGPDDA